MEALSGASGGSAAGAASASRGASVAQTGPASRPPAGPHHHGAGRDGHNGHGGHGHGHVPDIDDDGVISTGRKLPPAAARAVADLFTLTLLSAADGSLVALAAAGRLESLGGALTVGLLVVAGAGSWLAARSAFAGRRRTGHDWFLLGSLGVLTLAATAGSAWLGVTLGQAVTLHVVPKAAGIALLAIAAEVAGLRVPRPARVPLAIHVLALAGLVEVALAWKA